MRRYVSGFALTLLITAAAHGQTVEKRGFYRYHSPTMFGVPVGIFGIEERPTGGTILGGCAYVPGGPCESQLLAFTSTGAPSWTWRGNGSMYEPGPGTLIPLPDGGAVLVGDAFVGPGGLVRIRPNGQTDTSFGTNGYALFTENQAWGIHGGVLTSEERLVAIARRPTQALELVAFTLQGRIDSTFGTNGWTPLPSGHSWGGPHRLPGGDLLVAGSAISSAETTCALARYTSSGALRTRFGTNGVLRLTGPTGACRLGGSRLLADSTLLLFGSTGASQSALYRLTPNGEPVSSFGTNGWVTLPSGATISGVPMLDLATGRLMIAVASSAAQMEMYTLSARGELAFTTVIGGWDASVPGLTGLYANSRAAAVHIAPDGTVSLGGVAYGRDGSSYYGLTWALARIRYPTSADDHDAPVPSRGAMVFPLPARSLVRIGLPSTLGVHGRVHIDIVDMLGRTVLTLPDAPVEAGDTARLDVSALSPGRYIVRVMTPTGTATAPLVVAR